MKETTENKQSAKIDNPQVHMANERTYLAWVRTSIGIMAFGFVVEKFALFINKIDYVLGKADAHEATHSFQFSTILGIAMVAMGALMGVLAFARYKKVEREISADAYQPSLLLDTLITMGIIAIAIFFVIYLIHSI
jgi:putative membrane protein